MVIQKHGPLRGELAVPGDKSISHRSVMFGALSEGITEAENFLTGADCLSTISCFRQMGILVQQNGTSVVVHGKGLHGLTRPSGIIDAGNSGTTVRLLSGILAGQPFDSTITGDASIQKRPMKRVMTPLSQMALRSLLFMKTAAHRFRSKEARCMASITSHRSPPRRSNRVCCSPDCMQMLRPL